MKKLTLSGRLMAAAGMVTTGNVLADVGTDHGYLPIWLCLEGRIPSAIAMDVRTGPLSRAGEHILEAGLSDKIETRLSDGLEKLVPGEADSIAVCGMGGALICRILSEGKAAAAAARELILGPQSEVPEVRRLLVRSGFRIAEERMILEDGKYYTLIRAVPGNSRPLTEEEAAFGPCLLEARDPVLEKYLSWRLGILRGILARLEKAEGEEGKARRQEVRDETERILRAQTLF